MMREGCEWSVSQLYILSGEGVIGESGGLAGLRFGKAESFASEDDVRVGDEGHAVSVGEFFSALADEVDVLALFKDEPCGSDGVAKMLDTGDATGFHAAAVHEECVELDAGIRGKEGAATGVECGVVFKDDDGGFNGIESGTAVGEDFGAGLEGSTYAAFVVSFSFRRDGPGATMDDEDG